MESVDLGIYEIFHVSWDHCVRICRGVGRKSADGWWVEVSLTEFYGMVMKK